MNAKDSGAPASLELQLRASAPGAPEKVALVPHQQSLAADPPIRDLWMGKENPGEVSEPGRTGEGLQCAGLEWEMRGQNRRQRGRAIGGGWRATSSQVYGVAAHAQLVNLCGRRPGSAPAARPLRPAAQEQVLGSRGEGGDRAW